MPTESSCSPADVIDFWRGAGPSRWFRKDPEFDRVFTERFQSAHDAAARGMLDWAATPEGALALLILLDQFPRNAFRGQARAYATDPLAREVAAAALDRGFDQEVGPDLRNFFYLPLMHSEDTADQDRALELTRALGDEPHRHARIHRDIILRFGRFPHRNAVLGRATTPQEQDFLDSGGFAG